MGKEEAESTTFKTRPPLKEQGKTRKTLTVKIRTVRDGNGRTALER